MVAPMSEPRVFEVTGSTFEAEVLTRSRSTPVLLDFWAEWCEPCRTLGPVLERLAADYGGAFLLGKVDTEKERELAQAFGVQGIPFCVLMVDGRPADAFTGALPEAEIRGFLSQYGVEPLAAAEPEAVVIDPDAPAARWGAALAAIRAGDAVTARERLSAIPAEHSLHEGALRLLDGLAAFEAELELGTSPAGAALGRGREAFRAGDLERAVEAFLESMASDRGFGAGAGRRHAVLCLDLLGANPANDDLVAGYRRRMATLLF